MRFQAPRGTEDVLPNQAPLWQFVERTFAELARRYGYREIRTPSFEDYDLFVRSSGETSEVVSKQMYDFVDKGERHIALKPEGTAPAMRAVIEHNLCPPGTVERLYYVTPIFRYERPQKGRLREAHQVGLELIGSESAYADAEIVEMTVRFFQAVGLEGVRAEISSLGRQECRARYREAILAFSEPLLKDYEPEFREKVRKNPLRLLDTKDPKLAEAICDAPKVTAFLEPESQERLERVQAILSEARVPFRLNEGIVRGLDYYTETVFEVHAEGIGAQSALCGGGRYDELVAELGGSPTPSVGVAMGIERTLLAMEAMAVEVPASRPDVFVVCTPKTAELAQKRLRELRAQGIAAQWDVDVRSWKSQLRQADKSGARYALILGEDEAQAGTETLKNLQSGEQATLRPDETLARLTEGSE
jgi:histidyl-tRNA synthetase